MLFIDANCIVCTRMNCIFVLCIKKLKNDLYNIIYTYVICTPVKFRLHDAYTACNQKITFMNLKNANKFK